MLITTLGFMIFVCVGLIVYYLLPDKYKPLTLLVMSLFFSATYDWRYLIFILMISGSTYLSGLLLDKNLSSGAGRKDVIKKGRRIVTCTIVFDVAVLFAVKYLAPFLEFLNSIFSAVKIDWQIPGLKILMPLGISYYTLQALSYVIDVYWEKYKAERNYLNILLYVSYFPQMVQGPISQYDVISKQFHKPHPLDMHNIKFGAQLIFWGFFKKLVISERIAVNVEDVFSAENGYPYGLNIVLGLVYYGIQLYCDFSGGIDVIRGVSQMFGVELPINFRQPYFSKSLAEFWQRWHITLGAWMKNYIFYPVSMSSGMKKLKKSLNGKVSKKAANRIPIAISDIVVFLLVGLWHGAGYKFIAWGVYNGIILAVSSLLTDFYLNTNKRLGIQKEKRAWQYFSIFRTLIIVNVGWIFDCTDTPAQSWTVFKNMLMLHKTDFSAITVPAVALLLGIIVLVVSILSECGKNVREELAKKPFIVQLIVWILLIQLIPIFGKSVSGGFMYANF